MINLYRIIMTRYWFRKWRSCVEEIERGGMLPRGQKVFMLRSVYRVKMEYHLNKLPDVGDVTCL